MRCRNPFKLRVNPKLGTVSPIIEVPCGHCLSCRIARTSEWTTRMMHELDYWTTGSFLTLTYDDEHIPLDGSLVKKDLQNFFKRLRKYSKLELKYFACGEYGETTHRPHYHAVVFGLDPLEHRSFVQKAWTNGFVYYGNVERNSCQYVAGYVQKKLYGEESKQYGVLEPPFSLCSQSLGKRWCLDHAEFLKENLYVPYKDLKLPIPRAYRKWLDIDMTDYLDDYEKRDADLREYWSRYGDGERYSLHIKESREHADNLRVLSMRKGKL